MRYRKTLGVSVFILAIIGVYAGYKAVLKLNPAFAYEWITGGRIPDGIKVVRYGSMVNDNLLHVGHYWEFTHTASGLMAVLAQVGAGKTYENYENVTGFTSYDAIWSIDEIEIALDKNIDKNTIGRGYEIPYPNNRDSWLLVEKVGDRSYYVRN